LYEAYVDRVYAYVIRRVHNRAEAEDVTAEVFQQALENLGRYEWRGVEFARWLYRIAANSISDRRREDSRERGDPDTEPAFSADIERRAMLSQLVESLPADQQRVIHERFVEQRSIKEIAQSLGRSEGAVKQLQFRALEALRAQIGVAHG
jgi:RNA polymerase sigma-70 factor (ECF subfamily)